MATTTGERLSCFNNIDAKPGEHVTVYLADNEDEYRLSLYPQPLDGWGRERGIIGTGTVESLTERAGVVVVMD